MISPYTTFDNSSGLEAPCVPWRVEMTDREVVFVAYPSRDPNLAEMVMDAVRRANALPLPVLYQPWSFNDVPGNPRVSPILERIGPEFPLDIADITWLNP